MTVFRTNQPEEFEAVVSDAAPGARAKPIGRREFQIEVDAHVLARSSILSVSSGGVNVQIERPREFVGVTVPLIGTFDAKCDATRETFSADKAHILMPDHEFDFWAPENSRVLGINLFQPHLDEYLNRLNGVKGRRETRGAAWSERLNLAKGGGSSFMRFARFASSELTRGDTGAFSSGRACFELESALLTLFVVALDEQNGDILHPETSTAVDPGVRKAEEFIEATFAEPLTLADVAAVAGVPIRTLSRAFRARHGLGPMGFLRRRRLEAAQRALIAAEPEAGIVTRVALACGFGHFGRFSKDYRNAFGESPSETLRRGQRLR